MKRPFLLGPRTALLAFIILLLAPGPLLPTLVIDNAPENYFADDDANYQFEQLLRKRFPNDQFVFVLLSGDRVYDPATLAAIAEFGRQLEQDPRIERVLSVTSADHIRADDFGFAVEPLVDSRHLDRFSPEQWRQRVLSDRLAPDLLAGRDGRSLGLMVRPHEMRDSLERLDIQHQVEQALDRAGLTPLVVGVAGPLPLDVYQLRALISDNITFIPLTMAMIIALLYTLFRRWSVVLVCMAAIAVVGPLVISLLILFGRPFTLVDSMLPTLMMALTAALLIHLFSALRSAHRRAVYGAAAVEHATAMVRRPAFYASLTTALGLASLGLSEILPIRDFGLAAAAGALIAYAVVIFLLPPMLARWFKTHLDQRQRSGMDWVDGVVARISRIGIRHAGPVLVITALTMAAAVPLIGSIRVDTDMLEFFSPSHPLTVATRAVERDIGGVTPAEIVITTDALDGIKDPALLSTIASLGDWLEQQPEVDRAVSLVDIIEEMHWAFHGEQADYLAIPDNRELIAQYLLLYDGRDLFDVVNRDFDTARVVLSVNVHETSAVSALLQRIREHLAEIELGDAQTRLAGFGVLLSAQEALLTQGQLRGLALALLTIFIALIVVFRSVGAALLCMVPNLAPVLFIFATMGLLGLRLDVATALIAAVSIGIAVDDTIHFYSGYQGTRRRGHGAVRALLHSYRHAGRAVVATTAVLALTFLVITLSDFRPTRNFGLLTATGIIGALILDLLLLPALIMAGQRWRKWRAA